MSDEIIDYKHAEIQDLSSVQYSSNTDTPSLDDLNYIYFSKSCPVLRV